tara:strand:+ start:161 stop:502 length:342 start_codon:yes stop_codon:yes gene_type:complete
MRTPTKELLESHYEEHKDRSFFPDIIKRTSAGPVCCMVWEGQDVILTGRKIIGATNPSSAEPGTLRGDGAIATGRNNIHGSDSVESAIREINLWFDKDEVLDWDSHDQKWVYE